MRIERRDPSPDHACQLSSEIAEAVHARSVEGRVCSDGCTVKCPHCGSRACQCACSPDCPEAPRALSSDPDHHPIEPAITPLVFEMKRFGMFRPCWSCEGHLRPDGSLWKGPRVWFYCDSMVQIRLLAEALKYMENNGKLGAPWQIVVTYSDRDNPETIFSLEPILSSELETSLPALQKDAAEIARSLRAMITEGATALQREASKALAGHGRLPS